MLQRSRLVVLGTVATLLASAHMVRAGGQGGHPAGDLAREQARFAFNCDTGFQCLQAVNASGTPEGLVCAIASSPARDCASCNAGETCGVLGQGGLCAEQVNVCPDGTCDVPEHPNAQCVTDLSGNKICVIGSLSPCPCQGAESCLVAGDPAPVCAAVTGACDRNRTMFVGGHNAALSGRLSVLLRDPPSRTSTDPTAPKAQDDLCGTADPVTGALVLSARDPDGNRFVIEHVFDPCQVGSNGEKIDLCAPPDKIFRCVGNNRLAESHLTTSNQNTFGAFEIYLEDLALLGISDELVTQHGLSNQGNPVITWAERIGCVDHSSDLHASICEFYIEVKFLNPGVPRQSLGAADKAPFVAPVCGDGFWDPGEQCDGPSTVREGERCTKDCKLEFEPKKTKSK